jgi:O-antigen/teichoic acid export membrane protein
MLAWLILPLVALVAIGALAIWLVHALIGLAVYLVIGGLVAAGVVYLYGRAKRAVAPGTRSRRRIDAAADTYRMRDR